MGFVPVTKDNVSIYAAWFEDAELHKRLSPPNEVWLNHVTSPNSQAWLCYEEGFLQFIYINPDVEKSWIKEAERGLELFEQGKMKPISGEKVRHQHRERL